MSLTEADTEEERALIRRIAVIVDRNGEIVKGDLPDVPDEVLAALLKKYGKPRMAIFLGKAVAQVKKERRSKHEDKD